MRSQQTFYLLDFVPCRDPGIHTNLNPGPQLYNMCRNLLMLLCKNTSLSVYMCVRSHVNMLLLSQAFSSAASRHTWRGKTHTPISLCWDFQLVTDLPQTYFLHPLMQVLLTHYLQKCAGESQSRRCMLTVGQAGDIKTIVASFF